VENLSSFVLQSELGGQFGRRRLWEAGAAFLPARTDPVIGEWARLRTGRGRCRRKKWRQSAAISISMTMRGGPASLIQRGEIGRELLRQHGEGADAGVDAGGFGGGVPVDGGVDGDIGSTSAMR